MDILVAKENPLQQGLKPKKNGYKKDYFEFVAKENPLQQGLKQAYIGYRIDVAPWSQRKIHYNKD